MEPDTTHYSHGTRRGTSSVPNCRGLRDFGAIKGRRWRVLAEASAVLDSSLDYQDLLACVVRLSIPRLADYSATTLIATDGSVTKTHAQHRDPTMASVLDRLSMYDKASTVRGSLFTEALRTGQLQFVHRVDDAFLRSIASDEEHFALWRNIAPTSLIILPLGSRDRIVGLITLATTQSFGRWYNNRDVALAKEVADRIAHAVDRVRLYHDAQEAARMRDDMVAVVSHDLKNPLSSIQLATGLLLEELVPDDAAHATIREPLASIRNTAARMHRLIHDLLDVSATEAGGFSLHRSREMIGVLIHEAIESAQALARAKQVRLVAEVAPDLPSLDVDRERVLQVFANLLGNAIKFSRPGSRVVVSAALGEGSFVASTVADTGPGIGPSDLPHVFDRYWQVGKNRRGGVGLGLAIAKAIVDAHDGRIFARSVLGQGSQFSFALAIPGAHDSNPMCALAVSRSHGSGPARPPQDAVRVRKS